MADDKERSNIDQILERVRAEEPERGKLKIFFGAMAGVGKTFSMLEAARAQKKAGVDIVVGYVETHGRAETDALLEGLEPLPVKKVLYKNIEVKEFDIDAALKRRPAVILVDELAHTNAPASRHPKRWQDVEELLDAGIDVYTTLNVQHCESYNDVVAQITGISVRETVPDTFLEKADEIELVDLPPEDLLKRLKEGKVYLGEQAEQAIENFFQLGNLIALRQLALQYTARSVDAKMRSYKEAHSVSRVWNTRDHFLVCISSSLSAVNLIRAGKRIAAASGVEWAVVYVASASKLLSKKEKSNIADMMRLAEKLGAETVTLNGYDVASTLIAYARSRNITKIVIGKPNKPRWHEMIFGSVANELARKSGEIDIYLIGEEAAREPVKFELRPSKPFPWESLLWVALMVSFLTILGKILSPRLGPENIVLVFVLGVTLIAYRYGLRASMIAAFCSVLAFDYFFVPPYYTFRVDDVEGDLATFAVMFFVSIAISFLTMRLRQQSIATIAQENRARILYYLNRDLARTSNLEEIFQIAIHHAQNFSKCSTVIFTPGADKSLTPRPEGFPMTTNENAVAQWAYEHEKIAGKDTDTLPGARGIYLPLIGAEKAVGVMGFFSKEENRWVDPEELRILEIFAHQTALAIEGVLLTVATVKAEADIKNERLRNMLLSTFSFDLPAPLNAISKATEELLRPETAGDKAKRDECINKIRSQAEYLNNLSIEMIQIIKSDKVPE